jgi:hypothetical protein
VVFQLVYVSVAARPFTSAELVGLLLRSRARNAELGVTGVLLHRDGRFLQLLEGDEDVVRGLYASIAQDPRHHDVELVGHRRRLLRQFPAWTMTFRDLAEEPLAEARYSQVLEDAPDPVQGAVDELVARLRPFRPGAGSSVLANRVLGLLG